MNGLVVLMVFMPYLAFIITPSHWIEHNFNNYGEILFSVRTYSSIDTINAKSEISVTVVVIIWNLITSKIFTVSEWYAAQFGAV